MKDCVRDKKTVYQGKCYRSVHYNLWTCSECGKEAEWSNDWGWWPEKVPANKRHYWDAEPEYAACSDECRGKLATRLGLSLEVVGGETP